METNVQTVNPDVLVDLFPSIGGGKEDTTGSSKFGGSDGTADIFHKPDDDAAKAAATAAANAGKTPEELEADRVAKEAADAAAAAATAGGNVDILGDKDKQTKTAGAPITDLSAYYQERIKNGTFIAVNEVDDKGNKVPFIPKTAEEYDEVLQLQIDYQLDKAKKDLEKKWYDTKSPAWKAVSQYADMVDDPSQLIPFLQGVKVLTSVANLNENEADGAEQIVRTRMEQTGEPEEIITQQIEALKTTDTLIKTAKAYKPIIIKQEQAALAAQVQQEELQNNQWNQMVAEIRDSALKAIEQPIFGKTKLKQEEKAAIYDLIAEPSDQTKGYGIYNVIDDFFEKKNFEMLTLISLLATKKDAFFAYLGANVANQTAASLEKKLRLAGESHSSSGNDFDEENRVAITRNQYKTKPTFGRS